MYYIGDTHSLSPIFTIIDKHKIENSNLIHVGDFGLGFQQIDRDIKNLNLLEEALEETGNILYVIRGNHDNPIFWSKDIWLPKFDNIHLVQDHTIQVIEGKKVYFAGGAISIDRMIRSKENPPSYWKNEQFKYNISIKNNLIYDKNYHNIDVVVTHSSPDFAFPLGTNNELVNYYCEIEEKHGNNLRADLEFERSVLSEMYSDIKQNSKISHWIYGHFHKSAKQVIDGSIFKSLNINELYEYK
jgi:UDP-2,3-diacylglucosamine pyrophosphatase LpxH